MLNPISSLPITGTTGSSSGTGSSSSAAQTPSSSSQGSATATQATGTSAAATSAAVDTEEPVEPSESMAQQLLDALAAMAQTMSAGTPGYDSSAVVSGSPQDWASLRLKQTVESYLNF